MEIKEENFVKITKKHIKTAKEIIENGTCKYSSCSKCPLGMNNAVNGMPCGNNYITVDNVTLLKQFLELFDTEPKSLNFYERLSATLYGKQVLFKQDDGSYYNQSVHDTMTKSDVKEWLLAEVGELCKDK